MPLDLSVYRWGGRAVLHDALLYQVPAVGHLRFTYPPFAAAVFVPLSALPALVEQLLWTVASLVAVAYICRTCLLLAGVRANTRVLGVTVAAALVLEPVRHTFLLGQVNLFLLALVLWDIHRVARGRPAGVGIGIAAAVKLIPGLFIVFLILAGRIRSAVVATVTFAAATLLGVLVAPAASHEFWSNQWHDASRVGVTYISNQSAYGAVARVVGSPGNIGHWFAILTVVVAVVGLVTATVFARRGQWLLAATACGMTSLVVSPVSWTHRWVWCVPALLILALGSRRAQVAAGVGYVLFVASPCGGRRTRERRWSSASMAA
ncbi:MAG: alpha,2-mannosyltransferase [Frankiales bacterium]|jgi:alpha-1,2-mannosyltransferase|nr:alpha,2-mannosyltransferase [Frankiales bacterium]